MQKWPQTHKRSNNPPTKQATQQTSQHKETKTKKETDEHKQTEMFGSATVKLLREVKLTTKGSELSGLITIKGSELSGLITIKGKFDE